MSDLTSGSTFKFRCHECGQKLRVEHEWAGEWIDCPKCSVDLEIPCVKVAAPVDVSSLNQEHAYTVNQDMEPSDTSVGESPEEPNAVSYADNPVAVDECDDSSNAIPESKVPTDKPMKKQLLKKKPNTNNQTKTLKGVNLKKAAPSFKVKAKPKGKKVFKKLS